MSLYGEKRDISMFRHINRELMHKIISQQVLFYKYKKAETQTNIYGESANGRFFEEPVIVFALIEASEMDNPSTEIGIDFTWNKTFKLLRDDLVDNNIFPEIGDIFGYQNGFWEIDVLDKSQFFMGKDPDYPYLDGNNSNPYETDLGDFGYNVSVICKCHLTPPDKINIKPSRL